MTSSLRYPMLCVAALSLVIGAHSQPGASADAVRFLVIGDAGTGERAQFEVASAMADIRSRWPYTFVLMVGDNIYGGWSSRTAQQRFELPYRRLLDADIPFYASLGNHDEQREELYPPFHMNGGRYYSFMRGDVEFFALDSNAMDSRQLAWVRQSLEASTARWKIAFFHHPLYSSGQRHGPEVELRVLLEPVFVHYGVQVVFSGHDHVYERLKPQHGITYFVCGSSGELRRGNLDPRSPLTAAGFDQDRAFLAVAIDDGGMQFEAISRTGAVVDSGAIAAPVTH